MSLVARHLETAGIPTVIVGSARDIVEECGVARFLFVDFPLGNPCGKPWDVDMQRDIVSSACELLTRAWTGRTTLQYRAVWDAEDDVTWRENFMRVDESNRAALAAAGEERRQLRKQGITKFQV